MVTWINHKLINTRGLYRKAQEDKHHPKNNKKDKENKEPAKMAKTTEGCKKEANQARNRPPPSN